MTTEQRTRMTYRYIDKRNAIVGDAIVGDRRLYNLYTIILLGLSYGGSVRNINAMSHDFRVRNGL